MRRLLLLMVLVVAVVLWPVRGPAAELSSNSSKLLAR